jgi:hypothetical protein
MPFNATHGGFWEDVSVVGKWLGRGEWRFISWEYKGGRRVGAGVSVAEWNFCSPPRWGHGLEVTQTVQYIQGPHAPKHFAAGVVYGGGRRCGDVQKGGSFLGWRSCRCRRYLQRPGGSVPGPSAGPMESPLSPWETSPKLPLCTPGSPRGGGGRWRGSGWGWGRGLDTYWGVVFELLLNR